MDVREENNGKDKLGWVSCIGISIWAARPLLRVPFLVGFLRGGSLGKNKKTKKTNAPIRVIAVEPLKGPILTGVFLRRNRFFTYRRYASGGK